MVASSFLPPGFHQITPHLTVTSAAKAIKFYQAAFGARELERHLTPNGKVMHASVAIGDSHLMLNDEFPEMGGNPAPGRDSKTSFVLQLYVPDVDATFAKALAAGATPVMPVSDMFWGDRYGQLQDPFGYRWDVATRKEELSSEEVKRRADAFFAQHQPASAPARS